jgi:tetratricopeptide (TPR) repeat protein
LPEEKHAMTDTLRSPKSLQFIALALALSFLALGLYPAPVRAEDPAAVLAVVAGDVTIKRGEETLDGSFGASLQAGDIVETGADAQAAVLFESGQIIELGPGSRISVGSLPDKQGTGPVMAQVPDAFSGSLDQFAHTSSGEEGLAALPNLRSSGNEDRPDPITPRNSLVTPSENTFEWTPVEDVLEYRVIASDGDQKVSHGTEETTWTLADHELSPGEQWGWSVEAVTMDGAIQSDQVAFEVASEDQLAALANLEKKLGPLLDSEDSTRIDTATYLLGTYCRSAGFFNQAIVHLGELVTRHPDRKELHEELGFLYQAIGRNDKAAEEYKLALRN